MILGNFEYIIVTISVKKGHVCIRTDTVLGN